MNDHEEDRRQRDEGGVNQERKKEKNRKQENEYTSCCLTGDSVLLEIGTYIDDDAEMVFSVLDNGKGLLFKQWGEEENE